jgi:hypothetical protein
MEINGNINILILIGLFLLFLNQSNTIDIANQSNRTNVLINKQFYLIILICSGLYYYNYSYNENYNNSYSDDKKDYINKFVKDINYFYIDTRFIDYLYDIRQYSIFKSYGDLVNSINKFLSIEYDIYKNLDFQGIDNAVDTYKESMNLLHSFIYNSNKGLNNYFNDDIIHDLSNNKELMKNYNDNIKDFTNISVKEKSSELYNLFNTHINKMKKDARNQSVNHKTRLADLDNIEPSGDTTNFDYF